MNSDWFGLASNSCLGARRCLDVFPSLRGIGHPGQLSSILTAAAKSQWLEGARKLAPPRSDPAVALPAAEVQRFSQEPTNSHTRQCGRLIPLWPTDHVYLNRLPLDTRVAIAARVLNGLRLRSHLISQQCGKSPFPCTSFLLVCPREILLLMGTHQTVPDTFTLSGDNVNRITQLLRLAQRHTRLDQVIVGPHLQDALSDLEDTLSDQIAALDKAAQDDLADAEESGAAERERRAWRPLRAA